MTIVVLTGPSLSADDARAALHGQDAIILPPAALGDVLRAALERPSAIGIIDGPFFEGAAPACHEEILWAMSEGVAVYGSAGMGALRAAELAGFGMVGVGAIYRAVKSGLIEEDDEVAVAYAPMEDGLRALSEAMVNIRATLRAAEEAGVLGVEARAALERIAKGMFYPDRSYEALFAEAAREGLAAKDIGALRAFLPVGRINQMRADARAMLQRMREGLAAGEARGRASRARAVFEPTVPWEAVVRGVARQDVAAQPGAAVWSGAPDARDEAVLEEALIAGLYGTLVRRAEEKRCTLEAAGLARADADQLAGAGVTETELMRWYFEDRLGRSTPPDVEVAAREAGFRSGDALRRAALRELWFVHAAGASERDSGLKPGV